MMAPNFETASPWILELQTFVFFLKMNLNLSFNVE